MTPCVRLFERSDPPGGLHGADPDLPVVAAELGRRRSVSDIQKSVQHSADAAGRLPGQRQRRTFGGFALGDDPIGRYFNLGVRSVTIQDFGADSQMKEYYAHRPVRRARRPVLGKYRRRHSLTYVPSVSVRIEGMPRDLPRAKGPTLNYAIQLAKAAVDECAAREKGQRPGHRLRRRTRVLLSGDGAGTRSQLITSTKAAAAVKYRMSSGEVEKKAKADPSSQPRSRLIPTSVRFAPGRCCS